MNRIDVRRERCRFCGQPIVTYLGLSAWRSDVADYNSNQAAELMRCPARSRGRRHRPPLSRQGKRAMQTTGFVLVALVVSLIINAVLGALGLDCLAVFAGRCI